jgi:hypothetical protein
MRWLTFESNSDAFRDARLLGAPLRRALGRRSLRPRAADQQPAEPPAPLPGTWATPRPCPLRSPRRLWRAIWRARCTCWPVTPRTAWQPPWRGSGGRSWPATREFPRSARDAEKPAPELDPTCHSWVGPADQRQGRRIEQEPAGRPLPMNDDQTIETMQNCYPTKRGGQRV